MPLPEGVLANNIRLPFVICVNKCDLQSQVLREESNSKILVILYHLRTACIKCTVALIFRRSNSDLHIHQEQLQPQCALRVHSPQCLPNATQAQARTHQLRGHLHSSRIRQPHTHQVPLLTHSDAVVKIDVSKGYSEVVAVPISKKTTKEEIIVEENSKFFEKYINQAQLPISSN